MFDGIERGEKGNFFISLLNKARLAFRIRSEHNEDICFHISFQFTSLSSIFLLFYSEHSLFMSVIFGLHKKLIHSKFHSQQILLLAKMRKLSKVHLKIFPHSQLS